MKKILKSFGVIAFVAVIALSAVGCNNEQNPFPGTWGYTGNLSGGGTITFTITFAEETWTRTQVISGSSNNGTSTWNGTYTVVGGVATLTYSYCTAFGTAEVTTTGDKLVLTQQYSGGTSSSVYTKK